SFDPKTSISMIGKEVFASEANMDDAADRAAVDVASLNQEACVNSRFIFMEGTTAEIDKFCGKLIGRLGVERSLASAVVPPLPGDIREEIEILKAMDESYRVWGIFDGRGIVIRSEEPVGFHPIGKVVNVVQVPSLAEAVQYANVATQ